MLPTKTGLTENRKDGTVACKHRDLSCCGKCLTDYSDTMFRLDDGETYFLRDAGGCAMFIHESCLDEHSLAMDDMKALYRANA